MSAANNPGEGSNEFVIKRVFDAPRNLVFQAWSDPAHWAKWWGPQSCTATITKMDVRAGGEYRIVMHLAGKEYPMKGRYLEVVPNERLVYDADLSEHPDEWHEMIEPGLAARGKLGVVGTTTVTFADEGGKTAMTIRMTFTSQNIRDRFVKTGMSVGWSQSLEKLANLLGTSIDADIPASLWEDREILAVRILSAPRKLVFDAFTKDEHLSEWWGPFGFTLTTQKMDMKPGGVWQFVMHGPDGRDYPNHITYSEVVRPSRLVMKHGGDGDSIHFQKTITFDALPGKPARTKLTFRMTFPTAADRDLVEKTYGAVTGLDQTLSRLAERLSKMQ